MPEDDSKWTAEQRAQVIAMYQAGDRLIDITHATHVPRATIYWMLAQAGIAPSRMPKPSAEMMSVHDVLTRLQAVSAENGALREQLRQAEALIEALMRRLDNDVTPTPEALPAPREG